MKKDKRRFKKERPPDPHSTDAPWRLFISIPMPPAVVDLVDRLVTRFSEQPLPVRWIAPHTSHLTLHFLGDTPAERAELLKLALPTIVGRRAAFEIHTAPLGVFPNEREPRVIWLGLQGDLAQYNTLYADLARGLGGLEFEIEDRQPRPHITLGRVRDNPSAADHLNIRKIVNDWELARELKEDPVEIPVDRVELIRSFLLKTGPRHEVIADVPLLKAKAAD
jgi:2'-5' RNA ligase